MDHVILTVNSRLAEQLRTQLNQEHTQPHVVWETPETLPIQTWLQTLFHQNNIDGYVLLNDAETECLIQTIVQENPAYSEYLQPRKLSGMVHDAWNLLHAWNIPLDALEPYRGQIETDCLILWLTALQKKLQHLHAITESQLPAWLTALEKSKPYALPKTLFLAGFDEITPAITSLFDLLGKRIEIKSWEKYTSTLPHHLVTIALEDPETEIKTMAMWAHTLLQKNPTAKIGCVIPELHKQRAQVENIFHQIFSAYASKPFNISSGLSLHDQPMIRTALTALTWCQKKITREMLHDFLQSPFISHRDVEKNEFALIDVHCRKKNISEISLETFCTLSGNARFSALYKKVTGACDTEKKLPSAWAHEFVARLKILYWPGSYSQESAHYQLLDAFKKVLKQFSAFDFILETITEHVALFHLTALLQKTIFQPKSHHEPIQIIGVLEASGLTFDYAWVAGMNDHAWPQPAKPHALIPIRIQQTHQMPHATATREWEFCRHMTKRLKQCASEIILSFANKDQDQVILPSKLIRDIPSISAATLSLSFFESQSEIIFKQRALEKYEDRAAPIHAHAHWHGGNQILSLQAECPVRAFGKIRLRANALAKTVTGISAKDKGIFIHETLHRFWRDVKTQENLLKMSAAELENCIERYIDQALSSRNDYFFSVEKIRLKKLLLQWMEFEKTRTPFSVLATENQEHIQINALPLTLRIDRIDQYRDGSTVVIDYKTNTLKPDWLSDTMTQTQLPLYAITEHAVAKKIESIALARITKDQLNLYDCAVSDDYRAQWSQRIHALADDFCAGVNHAAPIKKTTCHQCEFNALCRYQLEEPA